jgi:hypothetical protein
MGVGGKTAMITYFVDGKGPFEAEITQYYRSTGTTYNGPVSEIEAASITRLVGTSMLNRMSLDMLQGETAPTWDTDLWERSAKQSANREINRLSGRTRLVRGGRAKTKLYLQIMSLGNQVRRLSK